MRRQSRIAPGPRRAITVVTERAHDSSHAAIGPECAGSDRHHSNRARTFPLAAAEPDKTQLVTVRFFGGLTLAETADALGVSLRTAER